MVDDTARDRAIYHGLKAADEVAAALQTHLIEEHGADPERAALQSPSTNSSSCCGRLVSTWELGLRAVQADHIAKSTTLPAQPVTQATCKLTSDTRHERTFASKAAMYKYTALRGCSQVVTGTAMRASGPKDS